VSNRLLFGLFGAFAIAGLWFVASVVVNGIPFSTRPNDIWEVPEEFRGLIRVQYGRSQCQALAMRAGDYVLSVPANGVICTSTNYPEGRGTERFIRVRPDGSTEPMRAPEEVGILGFEGTTRQLFVLVGTITEQDEARRQLRLGTLPTPTSMGSAVGDRQGMLDIQNEASLLRSCACLTAIANHVQRATFHGSSSTTMRAL
jgi:hypothetical protein